jgi:hypothetical protein
MCDIGPDHCPDVFSTFAGWNPSLFPTSPPNPDANLQDSVLNVTDDVVLYQKVRAMFSETERAWETARDYHRHPVTRMLINYCQKGLTWSWKDKPVKQTFFPDLNEANSPARWTMSDERLRNGAIAMAAKALYNGGGGNTVRNFFC